MLKNIFGALAIVLALTLSCSEAKCQSIKREGKVFTTSSSSKESSDVQTTYLWKDKEGNQYPIFLHKYTKGDKAGQWGTYVLKVSSKTGKEYKYYFPKNEEVAKEIRRDKGGS